MKKSRKYLLGLLLLLLFSSTLVGGYVFTRADTALSIPADKSGVRKLPFVVMAVRGRVEYLDKDTNEWKALESGSVLYEGATVNVADDAGLTMFSEGNASLSAGPKSLFSIGRAQRVGDTFDIQMNLKSGRIAARVAQGDSRFAIATEHGTYALTGGSSASVGTSAGGDDVAVATGRVEAEFAGGERRELAAGQTARYSEANGGIQEGPLADPFEAQASISLHVNAVGNAGGEAGPYDPELERKKLQDLVWWGIQQLRGRNFGELMGLLGPGFTLQGIPVPPAAFGRVVSDFDQAHQTLNQDISPGDVQVSLGGGSGSPPPSGGSTPPPDFGSPPPTGGGSPPSGGSGAPPSGGGNPPPPGSGVPPGGGATGIAPGVILAQENPPPPTGGPPPTCNVSGKVKYAFALKNFDGTWKIVGLEVIYPNQ